jgi:transposase-like protein
VTGHHVRRTKKGRQSDKGRLPEIKQRIVAMAVNGSGIRDTARVLGVSTDTVINELKKLG